MRKKLPYIVFLSLLACSCHRIDSGEELLHGAISTASPEATNAGMYILKQGGNAVDAAIAISFVLGVTEPAMSGIGGGSQVILFIPGQEKPFSINGSTRSPILTPTDYAKDSLTNHQRSTIPSTVKVMEFLFDHYASKKLSWATLLQPAIDHAQEGFILGPYRQKVYDKYLKKLQHGLPATSPWMIDSISGKVVQPALAKTLQIIASQGAKAFYEGEIADKIDQDMNDHNGWIRQKDLRDFPEPPIVESIHFSYKNYDIYTQPEPCGGWVVKEILQKLEDLESAKSNRYLDHLIQAIQYGHNQRIRSAQPDVVNSENGETTHFSIMDKDGMTIAITASINAYYGAGRAHPELGFLYNSYMDDFNYDDPANQYALGPGKMAYSSMSPSIVMKDGKVMMAIGSPGSARIISTVAQLVDRYISKRNPPSDLLNVPRVHVYQSKLYLEDQDSLAQLSPQIMVGLENISPSSDFEHHGLNAYFGGVHAIIRTNKELLSLADPRRDAKQSWNDCGTPRIHFCDLAFNGLPPLFQTWT